jgi:hypothetical protein
VTRDLRARLGIFAAVCLASLAFGTVYVVRSARDGDDRGLVVEADGSAREMTVAEVITEPFLAFRDTGGGSGYGRVAVVPAGMAGGPRAFTSLSCDRVHVSSGVGMCLRSELGVLPRHEALVFDERFEVRHRFDLAGLPSRTQVSPDGSKAAYTVFVTGHSYAEGGFSTRTAIIDTASGDEVVELEQMTVRRDGERFWREDFNLWGVTFTDDADRFYATLQTGTELFLVTGDLASGELTVVTDAVECPSLSPDGTRVAYKERSGGGLAPITWRVAVLDLLTLERWPLAETRDVDDQVEWLDDGTVMYGLDDPSSFSPLTDVWAVPADGDGQPRPLLGAAWSPVMVTP